ncbi:MAG TPA: glycosyltransferase family 2 protein [Candidatus Sulfotelmatobacter sp.]|jgi:glycosyltransferase involved in cell wall biosynthesis|nr:glycosyltransferase family 2 protein [Candidatus Sulfotelmatobacter sp.]
MPNLPSATVSIVVPFHNEEGNVVELYGRLQATMEALGCEYQFVFVDDGSTDLTSKLLKEVALIDPRVTVVRLRRNFGQTGALAAGFAHSTGEYVIAMDGDLQHDPAEIPRFLEKIAEGYDIVSGWRSHRIDNFLLRKIPSRCANWLMAKLSGVDIHDFGTTFKAYRGDLLRELPLYGEMHRFIPALASFYGASICEIPIQNKQRTHGESHYNISRTFRVFFDLMTIRFLLRYMSRPLHFFGRLGAINMGLGSVVALWLLLWKVVTGIDVLEQHGLLLVFAAVLILVGLHLIAVGLLGELQVWQYFNRSERRPYAISEVVDQRLNGKPPIPSEMNS